MKKKINKFNKMNFQHFRYNIYNTLFSQDKNKKEIILKYFKNKNFNFKYNDKECIFQFIESKDDILICLFRKCNEVKVKSKEIPIKTSSEKDWDYLYVFINMDEANKITGQQFIVQYKATFVKNLIKFVNAFSSKVNSEMQKLNEFNIGINPIIDKKKSFWAGIEKNKITKISYCLAPKNFLGHNKNPAEEMDRMQKEYGVSKAKVELSTDRKDGLVLKKENEEIENIVSYVERGGGSEMVAYSGKKMIYNSSKNIKISYLNNGEKTLELNPSNKYDDNAFDNIKKLIEDINI